MKKITTTLFILLAALILNACSAVDINTYQDNQPRLVLNKFFNGDLTAHGIIKNRSGEVIRYFNVTMTGIWDDKGVGTLAEDFIFNDGSTDSRTWTFTPVTPASLMPTAPANLSKKYSIKYSAKANDTLSPTPVDIVGNAFFMNYDLLINYDGDEIVVNIDDKMYLINNNTIINESVMTKYGIEVGYITLTIIKN